MTIKTGPLTREELQAVWAGATDKAYREPFVEAGEGHGLEVWSQLFEQLARTSTAIDVTTQALFIRPSSAQTNPPASGEEQAQVTLTISRGGLLDRALLLGAGLFVEEETTDWGPGAGVTVRTGRRYALSENLFFHPGEQGPFTVLAIAEKPGYGYNNPLPGTLRVITQPGAVFENNHATIGVEVQPPIVNGVPTRAYLLADAQPDMPVPDHVGQYLLLSAGDNANVVARMLNFVPPVPGVVGSQVDLERLVCFDGDAWTGDFIVGESVMIEVSASLVAYGTIVNQRDHDGATRRRVALVLQSDGGWVADAVNVVVTGFQSGATYGPDTVLTATQPTAETPVGGTGGSAWRVLDWALDWKVNVTNELRPSGGLSGMLDELGNERSINRSPGEDDESYRKRVAEIADVVSPNAIRRAMNRALGGYPWCFREVGSRMWRGFFYDGDNAPPIDTPGRDRDDAYDVDTITITGLKPASGYFIMHEPVRLEHATTFNVVAEGYFGRFDSWTANGSGPGVLTMIRKIGDAPGVDLTGYRVRGLQTGQIFTCYEVIENRARDVRKFRTLLDYEQFRAYFLIGLPKITLGEFGVSYDAGSRNAFDAAPFSAFYDGYGYKASEVYLRAQSSIDGIRAGGVGFQVYQEDSGCIPDEPTGEPLYLVSPVGMGGLIGQWESYVGLEETGGKVTAWRDQSPNAFDWEQSVDANRPLVLPAGGDITGGGAYPLLAPFKKRRHKALQFNGTTWLESIRKQFPNALTVVWLGLPYEGYPTGAVVDPANAPNTLWGDNDASASFEMGVGQFFWVSSIFIRQNGSNYFNAAQMPFAQGVGMFSASLSATADILYAQDGLTSQGPSITYVAPGMNRLGVGNANVDGFFGEVYAGMVFDRVLTAKELRLLFFRWQYLYF